jgi:hypothetical protein
MNDTVGKVNTISRNNETIIFNLTSKRIKRKQTNVTAGQISPDNTSRVVE